MDAFTQDLSKIGIPTAAGGASFQQAVSNLRVELIDAERNLLAVRGAVPGAKGGLVIVMTARKQPLAVIRARGGK